jgi:hypothetical protein
MNWHRQWWCFPVLIAVGLSSSVCRAQSLTYSSKELHGQVVETETGQPVEGAVVVASWLLSPTMWGHEQYHKRLHIVETVTDAEGRFVIPAWGPKLLPPLTELDETNPRLVVFKSSYKPAWRPNATLPSGPVLDADWNGKVIQLERFQGAIEAEARHVNAFYGELLRAHDDLQWDWQHYPRAIVEISEAAQRLKKAGLNPLFAPAFPGGDSLEQKARAWLQEHNK